jgi:hypothetical protein
MSARREEMSLAEAVDHLEALTTLDETQQPRWLKDPSKAQARTRASLHAVVDHLKHYCVIHEEELGSRSHLEGIRSLIALAGRAARQYDRLTALFHGAQSIRVAQVKELKELDEFVRTIVQPEAQRQEAMREVWEEEHADEWATPPALQQFQISTADQLRADTDYELLQIADEDGNRYFGPELLRSIRQSCRLTDYLAFEPNGDPLVQVHLWFDKNVQVAAQSIYDTVEPTLKIYFRQAGRARSQPLVAAINYAVMALMMARSPFNLLRNCAAKSCTEYFSDFHGFLRNALESEAYQNLVSNADLDPWQKLQLEVVHRLSAALFDHVEANREMTVHLQRMLGPVEKSYVEQLTADYERLSALLKRVPNGPIFKALDLLQEMDLRHAPFDPLRQRSLPCRVAELHWAGVSCELLRLPAPVIQEWINRPQLAPEFIGFLRQNVAENKHHLMINLQSRTSWKEESRALSLESLQRAGEMSPALTVVTLPKDNDFYHQNGVYHDMNTAETFFQTFLEQVGSLETGFFIPPAIGKQISWEEILNTVRSTWFGDRQTLHRRQRMEAIELAYNLFVCKLIEIVKPSSLSFTCKDGVDLSSPAQVGLVAFMQTMEGSSIEGDVVEWMRLQLFGFPLLVREREVHQERFNRCMNLCDALAHPQGKVPRMKGHVTFPAEPVSVTNRTF